MPGQRGTEKRRLGGQVVIRLAPGTAALVASRAADAGLSEAAWVRRELVDLVGADPADAVPVRALRPPRPMPTADVIVLARLRESVGEAVGTLRQVAGLDRARGGARLGELDAGIDRLLAAAADLDAAKDAALSLPPDPAR
jgi:hypothetical protein